jgi:DNA-binding response OmpR family regulator
MESEFPLEDMSVLLVDDTPANIDILRKTLEHNGLNISFATNGELALKLACENPPDLILLDVMMPGIDGFETCRRMKSHKVTKDIPIVFLTAKTDEKDIMEGFSVGGSDYVFKPFNRKEVLTRVTNHLKGQHLIHEKNRLIKKLQILNDELVESQYQYKNIIETISEIVIRLDPEGNISSINPSFSTLLGYRLSDIKGKPIRDLIKSDATGTSPVELITRRSGERVTKNLMVEFKLKTNPKSTIKVTIDCFGLWNLPNNIVEEKGVDKKFLGTLIVGAK